MDESRWAKQALLDHLSVTWTSPYVKYLMGVRKLLGLYELPMSQQILLNFTNEYFIRDTNTKLESLRLPWLLPVDKLCRRLYVQEGVASTTMAKFRYDVAEIGHKFPRLGRAAKMSSCPLCPVQAVNSAMHVAMFCPAIEHIRREQTSISFFRNISISKDFSSCKTYALFVDGQDWNGIHVNYEEYSGRGDELKLLLDAWLLLW